MRTWLKKTPSREELRAKLIAEPDVILDDRDLMKALIAANEKAMGTNIVDLRGIAMQRLETRLDRLEDTHRSVIAAAYENLAGTNQIHRAILAMLDPAGFEDFLKNLGGEVLQILRVEAIRLVLETETDPEQETAVERLGDVLSVHGRGFVDIYMNGFKTGAPRSVILRQKGRPRPPDLRRLRRRDRVRGHPATEFRPGQASGACSSSARPTPTSSAPTRAPTFWPSSGACSNAPCGAGCPDRLRPQPRDAGRGRALVRSPLGA